MNERDTRDIRAAEDARKRLAELREQKRLRAGSLQTMNRSRTTIMVNMAIGIVSGLLFLVGLIVVIRFLGYQRAEMGETSYRVFLGVMLIVGAFWLVFLALRIRTHLLLYSDAVHRDREERCDIGPLA